MKPKVLFVINSLVGGGAERVMTTLLAHSKDRLGDFDISLALLDDLPRSFDVPDWLQVHQLDCKGRTFASIAQLRALVRKLEPVATVSFLTRSNVACTIASLERGTPCIISERTSTAAHLGRGLRPAVTKALIRLFYPRATRVIAPSRGIAAKLTRDFRVREDRVEVIPNPVDTEGLARAAADETAFEVEGEYIMAIGRLAAVKNYDLLVRAFASSGLSGRLVVAGEGLERERLEQLAKELGIGDRLVLPGFLRNPYRALGRASLFALSSNVEGFPNALLEALALKVPVVATNCEEGPAEILARLRADQVEGLSTLPAGILTPVGDVENFARALQLGMDPAWRAGAAGEGGAIAAAYSPAAIVDRYWSAIERARATERRGAVSAAQSFA